MASTPTQPGSSDTGAADDEKVAAGSGISAPAPAEGGEAAEDGAERGPGSPQG